MSKPTIEELDTHLKNLVKWEQFALHLPKVDNSHIEIIKRDHTGDTTAQKRELYDKWLRLCPHASWLDVVQALETAEENAIAKNIRDMYCPVSDGIVLSQETPESSSTIVPTANRLCGKVSVQEDVSTELEELRDFFLNLVRNIKSAVKVSVSNGNIELKSLRDEVLELQGSTMTLPESVTTTDQLFDVLRPHYNFLNCRLIISIAKLLSGTIADEAERYNERIKQFKVSANVKCLRNILKKHYSDNHKDATIVKIVVEDCWGEESLELVEILIKTLFPVAKHPNYNHFQWYQVTSGSLVLSFVVSHHLTAVLIKEGKSKIAFMRCLGIISLSIGDEVVWKQEKDIHILTFKNCLIQATISDNLEAVEFLLEHVKVDVNVTYDSSLLINVAEEHFYSELEVEQALPLYCETFIELLKDVDYYLPQSQLNPLELLQDEEVQVVLGLLLQPNFLNDGILADENLLKFLPQLSNRIKTYRNFIALFKRQTTIKCLSGILPKYIPQTLPNYKQIIIALQTAWGECSVHYIEELGELVFSTYEFQLINVESYSSCFGVTFLIPNYSIHSIKDQIASKSFIFWQSLGGIKIIIDNMLPIDLGFDGWYSSYKFSDAVSFAEKNGADGKLVHLLKQICEAPKDFKQIICADNNNNYGFLLHPGSTPLIIACCNDNSDIVRLLLHYKADPNWPTIASTNKNLSALVYSTGNTKLYKMLINHGADVSALSFFTNETTLYCACLVGNVKIVKLLLSQNHELAHMTNNSGELPLHMACRYGHIEIVNQLLKVKADPNIRDEFTGRSPFMLACSRGYTEIVEQLLHYKTVDVSLQDKEGLTALMLASSKGHLGIVKLLIHNYSDLNVRSHTSGTTAFNFACLNGHIEVVKLLLQAKCDPNIPDYKQCTAIQLACRSGHTEIVDLLLKLNLHYELNINVEDSEKWTPLMTASRYGHSDVVRLLHMHKANPNLPSVDGSTPLILACGYGHLSTVQLLFSIIDQANLNVRNKLGFTAFHLACKYGYTEIIKLLIKENVNLNICDNEGITPLMSASMNGHVHVVDLLLCHNVDPNLQGHKNEFTALMLATTDDTCHLPVVDRLLQSEADPNIQNVDGWSALMLASKFSQVQIVQRLLQVKKINLNLSQKNDGYSALMLANINRHFEVVCCLLEGNADPNLQDAKDSTVLMQAISIGNEEVVESLMRKSNVLLDVQDIKGQSALHIACAKGHGEMINSLLNKSANPNIQNKNGETPIMLAITSYSIRAHSQQPFSNVAVQKASLDSLTMIVDWLLKHNANPNTQDVNGSTALLLACTYGLTPVVDCLLEYNADPNIQDGTGSTPLLKACIYGYEALVYKLLKSKANISIVNNKGESPLMRASFIHHISIVKKLIECKADLNSSTIDGRTALMYACDGLDGIEVINYLLQARADPNVRDKNNRTLLIAACCADNQQIALRLLKENIDVNVKAYLPAYDSEMTALMIACKCGQEEVVTALLEKPNIEMNLQDSRGQTSLMIAIRWRKVGIALSLINHCKVDVNIPDESGQTPILEAFQHELLDVFRLLLRNCADPSIENNKGSSALKVIFAADSANVFQQYISALKEAGY